VLLIAAGGSALQAFTASSTLGLLDSSPNVRSMTPIATSLAPVNMPPMPDWAPQGAYWNFQGAYGATIKNDVVNGNTKTITGIASIWAKVTGPDGNEVTTDANGKDVDDYFP
jgi:hypothetical protein